MAQRFVFKEIANIFIKKEDLKEKQLCILSYMRIVQSLNKEYFVIQVTENLLLIQVPENLLFNIQNFVLDFCFSQNSKYLAIILKQQQNHFVQKVMIYNLQKKCIVWEQGFDKLETEYISICFDSMDNLLIITDVELLKVTPTLQIECSKDGPWLFYGKFRWAVHIKPINDKYFLIQALYYFDKRHQHYIVSYDRLKSVKCYQFDANSIIGKIFQNIFLHQYYQKSQIYLKQLTNGKILRAINQKCYSYGSSFLINNVLLEFNENENEYSVVNFIKGCQNYYKFERTQASEAQKETQKAHQYISDPILCELAEFQINNEDFIAFKCVQIEENKLN